MKIIYVGEISSNSYEICSSLKEAIKFAKRESLQSSRPVIIQTDTNEYEFITGTLYEQRSRHNEGSKKNELAL